MEEKQFNESGLCLCGCGRKTEIINRSCQKRDLKKGKYRWFIHGHNGYQNKGIKNGQWKGGWTLDGRGYVLIRTNKQNYIREHILFAEKVLGKELPEGAVVHHVNGDKTKQEGNLVICENNVYHLFLHKRKRAFEACGHANWLKCELCHQYDKPDNLNIYKYGNKINALHSRCRAVHAAKFYTKEKRKESYRKWKEKKKCQNKVSV